MVRLVGLADMVTVGLGFTTTVCEAVAEHPLVVPVTVYVVVVVGENVRVTPEPDGVHE